MRFDTATTGAFSPVKSLPLLAKASRITNFSRNRVALKFFIDPVKPNLMSGGVKIETNVYINTLRNFNILGLDEKLIKNRASRWGLARFYVFHTIFIIIVIFRTSPPICPKIFPCSHTPFGFLFMPPFWGQNFSFYGRGCQNQIAPFPIDPAWR